MTTNTPGNVIGTCSATESSIKLKLELEKTFKLAKSVDTYSATESSIKLKSELEQAFWSAKTADKILETFEIMASASCFKDSELAVYCWSITQPFLQLDRFPNPHQVLTFGNTALTILNNNQNNIRNIACFGRLPFIVKLAKTRSHGLPLFVACVYHLLGTACYQLYRYKESLLYLDTADRILSELDKNDNSSCLLNCVRQVLIATQQRQYNVMVDMGQRGMAIAQARKVLKFTELTMEGDSTELCDAYVNTYMAYAANLDAKRALPFCVKALEICIRRHRVDSRVVAYWRFDLAILYNLVGKFKEADHEWELSKGVLESTNDISDIPRAAVRSADFLFNLGKYKEVIAVLAVVVACKGMEADDRVSAFLTMAKASIKLEKFDDARNYVKEAESVLPFLKGNDTIIVCSAYLDMSDIHEMMNESGTAISWLKRVWEMSVHHQETSTEGGRNLDFQKLLAASCTRLFELISQPGRAKEETLFMIDVAEKLEQIVGREHIEVGHGQGCAKFGFVLLESDQADLALKVIKKAKDIMEVALDPQRVDSLRKARHLSAKLGRINDAAIGDINDLGPSEKYFEDKDVSLLNNLISYKCLVSVQDSKDLS